jgi:hypothetical protein
MIQWLFLIPISGSIDVQVRSDILARFPANFSVQHTNESFSGFASLDLYKYTNSFTAVGDCSGDWYSVSHVSFGNCAAPITVDFVNEIPEFGWDSENLATVNIGASIGSMFARDMGSFLYNPKSNESGEIILQPSDPTEYAYRGELFHVANSHPVFWAVPISVRVLGHQLDDDFQPCFLHSNANFFWVPRSVFDHVRGRIAQSGMTVVAHVEDGHRGMRIGNIFNQSQIDSLPIIQFVLETGNLSHINIAQLEPREYIVEDPNDPSTQLVLFRTRNRDSCSLNSILLKNLVVHFDARNSRVGFGDPIDEI